MLISTEHKLYQAHKCYNANKYWHLTTISMVKTMSESLKAKKMYFQHFSFMSISNFMLKLFMKKVAETVISLNTCMHFAFSSSGERITLLVL